ncbi:MAG: rod shape-determining protein [Oscillospiraceae bacterium]|nr:rod shape-determining protein [Oscillospiraceae bacterium]
MPGLHIGIDLGTTSIIIFVEGKGIVLHESSIAALDVKSGQVLALGNSVYDMLGRNPDSLRVVRPMRDGVISDFTVIHAMVEYFIRKICGNRIFKPSVMICMPASVTGLEKNAILELAIAAGAGRACLVEEPLAAALGAGMNIAQPNGRMVVDIGGGTVDVAVITMGTMAIARSAKVAGNALNEAIQRYIRRERNVLIGELTAEDVKRRIGCAYQRRAELAIGVRGQNYISRLPTRIEVNSSETFFAMRERLNDIADTVHRVLEQTPPEMAGDIYDQGILLTGGGSLLHGLDVHLSRHTGIRVAVAPDPVNCVALGMGKMMKYAKVLSDNNYYYRTDDDIGEYARSRNL